jgi:hypothetical protein
MDGVAVLPERTQHLAFGEVAAAWSMIERLGISQIIDEVTGSRRVDAAAPGGHLYRAGHAEPGRGPVLEAGVRGLVGHHPGGPVGEGPGC